MPMQGSLSIERMCRLTGVSRAGFYRCLQERLPVEEDMEVRSAIQQIAVEHRRRYGYRRIAAELRRSGMWVNHKRVARIMREDNLLAVQPRAFVVTTDSQHQLEVYLNLASRMKLTGVNQLWVADITYIRLHREFVYLAVILDAYSRKVVGWELDGTLAARLPIAALEKAIAERKPPPGLVHHSDRGVQYASGDYVRILTKHQMIPSMSRPANPYDNASCESFLKTLKREEIYASSYENLDHLRVNIGIFVEQYYNQQRLHSALGYRSPEEFERQAPCQSGTADSKGATITFFTSSAQSSTGMPEQGTQRRPLLQTSSPLENHQDGSMNDRCAKGRLSQWKGSTNEQQQVCQSKIVSTEGFTPPVCVSGVPVAAFLP
ncbi:MAG: IS3 family transposase [Acidobacteria bacterium]|nr:MAG: IS3 family transposase [Acidobacteriota bacterium]